MSELSNRGVRHHQSGISLVSMVVGMTLTALVVQFVVSSLTVLTRDGELGQSKLQFLAKIGQVENQLTSELRLTSTTDSDPVTGLPYLSLSGVAGDRQIDFRRVSGFATNGLEVIQVWSSPVTLKLNDGNLERTQDGRTSTLCRSIRSFDAEIDEHGRLQVTYSLAQATRQATEFERERVLWIDTL